MNVSQRGSATTLMESPVRSAPRPSAPSAQCRTALPSKCPPVCTTVTPGSTSSAPDLREPRLDLPHDVPMPGSPQLLDGGPPLATPSDVLPLVLADGAPGGRLG